MGRPLSRALATDARRTGAARRGDRSRRASPRHDGARRAPRRAQDEGVRAIPARRGPACGWTVAICRLVRSRPARRRTRRAVLRAPLPCDALVDPHAGSVCALGSHRAPFHSRPTAVRRTARRRDGGAVAHLLREHVQPRAPQPRRDARRDAAPVLERPARGAARARPRARGAAPGRHDAGAVAGTGGGNPRRSSRRRIGRIDA